MQVLPECCYTYTKSSQWDAGTAWMLLYIHGKFTVGCMYCLNVVIHTRKVIPLWTFRVCITTFRQYLHPIVNFPCIYNNNQAVPASHCKISNTKSSQWDAGTTWMLLYIHGKFTVGCMYCLNVVIDTWKVYNGMQVLLNVAIHTVCIATFRQYLHPIVNFPCIYNNIQGVPASHCELSMYLMLL
jgi:hypothetical protein